MQELELMGLSSKDKFKLLETKLVRDLNSPYFSCVGYTEALKTPKYLCRYKLSVVLG